MPRCPRSGAPSSASPTTSCASRSASKTWTTSKKIWLRRSIVSELIDLLLHVDVYLLDLIANYGVWIYAILFAIVFAETGLVVTPFLPGDSLLFATGAIAATGALDVRLATILVLVAAISGDAVNYSIGRSAGVRIVGLANTDRRWSRWINIAYIARAHEFFERHGGKAIVLGRFMPIV